MADYSGALKKFRESGYPKDEEESDDEKSSSGVRIIKLTDDEAKALEPYQAKFGPGEEMVVEATGKLEGTDFRITGVKYASGGKEESGMDGNADAEAVMAKMRGPMTQSQTIPSPS